MSPAIYSLSVNEASVPKTTWEAAHLVNYESVPIPHCQHTVLLLGSTDQQFQGQLAITTCLLRTAQRSRCAAAGRAPHTTRTIASITIFTVQALVVKENILP